MFTAPAATSGVVLPALIRRGIFVRGRMDGMLPWFSLRDLLGGVTLFCAIAGLMHGGVNYSEPFRSLCLLGLLFSGVVMVCAACYAAANKRR